MTNIAAVWTIGSSQVLFKVENGTGREGVVKDELQQTAGPETGTIEWVYSWVGLALLAGFLEVDASQ